MQISIKSSNLLPLILILKTTIGDSLRLLITLDKHEVSTVIEIFSNVLVLQLVANAYGSTLEAVQGYLLASTDQ
jgi:hypothetical protein